MAPQFHATVNYEDPYVQPLILAALESHLPPGSYELLLNAPTESAENAAKSSRPTLPLLQWRSYETLDFQLALSSPRPSQHLINAYTIRKALIRKHYLSNTIFSWVTKHPSSPLTRHFKPCVEFELDYAEFLDEALIEAYELREAFQRNEGKTAAEREWWILKPGMSDRGGGIRLFSTEGELLEIFEGWEAEAPDSDADEDEDQDDEESKSTGEGIVTSHLRHFIAQPYIHPPLLIPASPFNSRKFHIRTYIVVHGALRVYVYKNMLALFASEPYTPPWDLSTHGPPDDDADTAADLLQKMRNIHLTNTCVQNAESAKASSPATDPNVFLLSSLPLSATAHAAIASQIESATAELFRAAVAHPTNFQPLPVAFEVFGVDFLVEGGGEGGVNVQLLEVNAFPDFAQTGDELRDVVVKGLFEEVVKTVVGPHFGVEINGGGGDGRCTSTLVKVLDLDLGRR